MVNDTADDCEYLNDDVRVEREILDEDNLKNLSFGYKYVFFSVYFRR